MFLPLFLMISSVSLFLNVYAGDVPPSFYEFSQDIKNGTLFEIGDVIMESSERKTLQKPLLDISFLRELSSNKRFQQLCIDEKYMDFIQEKISYIFEPQPNKWSALEPKDFAEVFENDKSGNAYRFQNELCNFLEQNKAFWLFLTQEKEIVPLRYRVDFSSLMLRKKYEYFNEFYPLSHKESVNNSFHHIFMVGISCLQHGLLLTYNECPYIALHIYMRMKKDPIILNNIMSTFLANDPVKFNELLVKTACGCDVGERIIKQYPNFSTLLSETFKNVLIQKTSYFILPDDSIQPANYDLKKDIQTLGKLQKNDIIDNYSGYYYCALTALYSYRIDENNISHSPLNKWRDHSIYLLGNDTRVYSAHRWLILKPFSREIDTQFLGTGKGELSVIFNDIVKANRGKHRDGSKENLPKKRYSRETQKFLKKYLLFNDAIKCFFGPFINLGPCAHPYFFPRETKCTLYINHENKRGLLTDMLNTNERYIAHYNGRSLEENLDDNAKTICTFIKLHMKYSASPLDKPQLYDENSEMPYLLYKRTSNKTVHAIIKALFNIEKYDSFLQSFNILLSKNHAFVERKWQPFVADFWYKMIGYKLDMIGYRSREPFTKSTIDWEKFTKYNPHPSECVGQFYEAQIKENEHFMNIETYNS